MAVGLAVFFISMALVGHEILLMRLLSITQWHHFASMIISLALLGLGASGTFNTLFQKWLIPRFHSVFCCNAILFGLAVPTSFSAAQLVPLNPLEILWDSRQWLYLLQTYLILLLPFFFAGNCLTIALARFKGDIHRIYFFDLLGAGLGALGIVGLLFVLPPWRCLPILSAPGFAAAGFVRLDLRRRRSRLAGILLILFGGIFPLIWPQDGSFPRISAYKGLSTALLAPGSQVIAQRASPLGWLAVVESPSIPFRYAPGMSLQCTSEPPAQLGIFVDGDSMSPVIRFDGRPASVAFLDCLTSALPFHLLRNPRVLVLGAGGGMDVLMARIHGAQAVDAVELDANMISLVKDTFGEYAGHVYSDEKVRIHAAEARSFVSRTDEIFDLIQVSLLDSFTASATGGHALSESYLYTVEALGDAYRRLGPGGFLSITRWLKVPPRDSLKLFATAVLALERSGVSSPGRQMALIRSWSTTTLLIKKGELSEEDLGQIRDFCAKRSFDIDFLPGVDPGETNRFNVLDESYLSDGAQALLGERRGELMERYKFAIEPATDDRPYFFHFFKWRALPEILSSRGRGGLPLIEWAYPVMVMTLVQALVLSLLLILIPLFFLKRRGETAMGGSRIAVYFSALGLAFLFMEMAFIQKLILFLGHPIYAASVVIAGFLVFAGLGSRCSAVLSRALSPFGSNGNVAAILAAVAGIVLLSALYMVFLPGLFARLASTGDTARIVFSMALIAPLAFPMGMPFPLGLAILGDSRPAYIPWAWGINGCTSVLATVLASLLAIHFGFNTVVMIAAALYTLAAMTFCKAPDWIPAGSMDVE
ncbi:MAG: SAM-dependent methyltransferase [Syntrophobacteraceae bacterium]